MTDMTRTITVGSVTLTWQSDYGGLVNVSVDVSNVDLGPEELDDLILAAQEMRTFQEGL